MKRSVFLSAAWACAPRCGSEAASAAPAATLPRSRRGNPALQPSPPPLLARHLPDLPALLRPGALLVFNDTKVIPARLGGRRGLATVAVTLARDAGGGTWLAYAKGARRLRPGDRIEFAADFAAEIVEKCPEGEVTLRFDRE